MFDNMMGQFQQEERAYLHEQLQQMRVFSEDLQRVEADVMEHADKRLSDLEHTFCGEDDVVNQTSQRVAGFNELFDG